jgi:tetratricopeptide (TPR) repeat protein
MSAPAARADVRGDRNIVVQAVGSGINVTIDARVPHLRLTQFEARTARAADGSDAALLSAYRTDVVPLLGREQALGDLRRWLASDRDVSIRVLTGGAGRGKTRLALELAREAAGNGWLAGFVESRELDRFRCEQNVAEWAWDKPVLIVIDYAASRADQLRDWISELVDAPAGSGDGVTLRPPLRLLLLERQAQREIGWLATVAGHGHDERARAAASLFDPPEPVELAAIDDLPARRQIFATLLARKRADLVPPEAGADVEFDRLLQHKKWSGDPLFLMMAGLVAGTHGINNALALTRMDLATIIARRELDRIGAIAAGAGVDAANRRLPGFLARHAAVLATLCQGLTLAESRALIEAEAARLKSSADIGTTVAALQDGLPGTGGGPEIAPILPDIVGEAAVMCWLGEGGVLRGLGIDPLTSIHGAAATALARTSQVLVRTAQDFAAAGRDEPVRWLYAIAQAAETDSGALITIANALPDQTVALRELAAELTQSIVDRLRSVVREDRAAEAILSAWLTNLGVRLINLGRREEALAASQEAVTIYRHLAEIRPDAFLPLLATSLNNLGLCLYNLDRREEALAASQEGVAIRKHLAETNPDAFSLDLAAGLNNVGMSLSNLGRWEEALVAIQEAVVMFRHFAETYSDAAFLSDLATILNNLSCGLSSVGRHEEALAASQEAVVIRRRLAETLPDAFLHDLATSLNNLGNHLSKLGRVEDALVASQEAVAFYRRLAESRPDTFSRDLGVSLNNLSIRLSDLGRREAIAASQEAVAIYRRLAETRPDAFLPDLATSISVMSDALAALGRHREAAQAATQALEILAPFVERYPQAYKDLAREIAADVLRYSEVAGQLPDNTLLARVARALGDEAVDEDPVSEVLKARIDAIIDAAQKTGALDEDALAELPPEIVGRVRAAWAAAQAESSSGNTPD